MMDHNKYLAEKALMRHEPLTTLRIVRTLLTDVRLWTQSALARNDQGRRVGPTDSTACMWSVMGAVALASNINGIVPPAWIIYLDSQARALGLLGIIERGAPEFGTYDIWETFEDFHDQRTHQDVMNFLDTAIEELRSMGYR